MTKLSFHLGTFITILILHFFTCCYSQYNDSYLDSLYDKAWNQYDIFQMASFDESDPYKRLKSGFYDQRQMRLKYFSHYKIDPIEINNCHELTYLTFSEISDPAILQKIKFENFPELSKFGILDNLLTNEILLELCKCKKLRYLIIIGSAESLVIPKEIINLSNLQALRISSVKFESVSSEFSSVAPKELAYMGCDFNGNEEYLFSGGKVELLEMFSYIKKLPESMAQMTSLSRLYMMGSGVEDVDVLGNCKNLFIINLSSSAATELPSLKYTKLRILGLMGVQLKNLPELPNSIASIQIENSKVQDFNLKIEDPGEVKFIIIKETPLESIPESWRRLRNLNFLHLMYTNLQELPDWISELPIETLDLHEHKLLALPKDFHKLPLKQFNLGSLTKVKNWQEVYMLSNPINWGFGISGVTEAEWELFESNPEIYPFYQKAQSQFGNYTPIIITLFTR